MFHWYWGSNLIRKAITPELAKKKYMEELQQLKPLASEPAHLQKDMVKIEGGSYWHTEETGQRRQVTVASFWLDRYEVSNLQYHEFLPSNRPDVSVDTI